MSATSVSLVRSSNDEIFARDGDFWKNYERGRPKIPSDFFDRVYRYHELKGGRFDTAHDAGAGNGVHSEALSDKFSHVIISDVAQGNVRLAKARLGTDKYSYRTLKIEDTGDIAPGSVDLVFIMNALHWADQRAAMKAIATQLKPGGTFACAGFGQARFNDARVQDLWERMSQQGGRVLLETAEDPAATLSIMARTEKLYNVAPLDPHYFELGALRTYLNMESNTLTGIIPPENRFQVTEPDHTGVDDVVRFERDESWRFDGGVNGFKDHFYSFPHATKKPEAFKSMLEELEDLSRQGCHFDGYWLVTLILATRRR